MKSYKSKESSPYLKMKDYILNSKDEGLTRNKSVENQQDSIEYI